SSGYCTVTGFAKKKCQRVVIIPWAMPEPYMATSRPQDGFRRSDPDGGDPDDHQTTREEPLPGEVHELIVAEPRKRGANPHEDEDQEERLPEERDDAGERQRGDERDRAGPAAQE